MSNTILFLCPHHAAKSVLAEAYFNRAMAGTDFRAISAGTEPDEAIMPSVAHLLQSEGMDFSGHQPRRVTHEELATAVRIISMGCTAEELGMARERLEQWGDVPPVSQNIEAARDAILSHIELLVKDLQP